MESDNIQIVGPVPFGLITSSSLIPIIHCVSNFPNTVFTFYKTVYVID